MRYSNYPAGVTDAHPHFNPPLCPSCKTEAEPGENCEACGEYFPDRFDIEEDPAYEPIQE